MTGTKVHVKFTLISYNFVAEIDTENDQLDATCIFVFFFRLLRRPTYTDTELSHVKTKIVGRFKRSRAS